MSGSVIPAEVLSAAPILEAVEQYRGTMIDLDRSLVLGPDGFARARASLIAQLRRAGLQPGDRVLVAITNGPLFIAALTGILACEASPLLVHAKTPPAELLRYADRFGVRYLATQLNEETPLDHVLADSQILNFDEHDGLLWGTLAGGEREVRGPELRGVPLHPTSGSTGLPKIALRPGLAAMEEARHYAATMQIDAQDHVLAIPPMSHAYGYGVCVMTPLLTGASIVSSKRFSAKQIHKALSELPITVMPTVPAYIDVLLFASGLDFSRLRWLLAAGAMLPARSANLFRQKTGVTVCPLYGTTETGGISVATAADGRDLDGRVGPPMDGVEVEVWPDGSDADLGPDIGKVNVRSSSMMYGYLDDAGNITHPLDNGWFVTGDLARIAEDGVIHLRGRNTEVINVAGLKVVPCEVEEEISQMRGVKEVKVYAGEHVSKTQIVKACIAVEEGITEANIRAHCEQHLVYYKRPQQIAIVAALPRNPAGKIIREELP